MALTDENILQINMLGGFSLTYHGETMVEQTSRSGKVWTLLEYLVTFHEKDVSQNEVIELLWPDDESISDPSNTLKTLLHRVRTQLATLADGSLRKAITYRRGSYRWAPEVPFTIDVEEFDKLCKQATQETDDGLRLELLRHATSLYKGDFLPRSALEPWVIPINTYYRTQYVRTVYETLELMTNAARFDEALDLCQRAIAISPYEEGIHQIMIQTLLAKGAQQEALQHYKHVTDLFFDQFGVSPSDELTALYKEVVKTDKSMELDLNIIKEGLQEDSPEKRAFYCEYAFFKDFYQLGARSALRTGQAVQIALITISSSRNKDLTQAQITTTMEQLKEVIAVSLRRNDVFSRYSLTQYLLMLPMASFENGQMILSRITTAYHTKHPRVPITLQCKLLPLDPIRD